MSTIDLGIAENVVRLVADVVPQKKVQAAVVAESSDFYVGSVKIESQSGRTAVSRTVAGQTQIHNAKNVEPERGRIKRRTEGLTRIGRGSRKILPNP